MQNLSAKISTNMEEQNVTESIYKQPFADMIPNLPIDNQKYLVCVVYLAALCLALCIVIVFLVRKIVMLKKRPRYVLIQDSKFKTMKDSKFNFVLFFNISG